MSRSKRIVLSIAFCVSVSLIFELTRSVITIRIPVTSVDLLPTDEYSSYELTVRTTPRKHDRQFILVKRDFRWKDALIPSALTGLFVSAWATRPGTNKSSKSKTNKL